MEQSPALGAAFAPGTPVEVRSRFDATWARGFVVAGMSPQGYAIQRLSDGAVLPAVFRPEDLRPSGMPAGVWMPR
jgi:hypothetical protein